MMFVNTQVGGVMHGKHEQGQPQVEMPVQRAVRGCGTLRPHDPHEYSTRVASFSCPGVHNATPAQRQIAEDLVQARAAAARR